MQSTNYKWQVAARTGVAVSLTVFQPEHLSALRTARAFCLFLSRDRRMAGCGFASLARISLEAHDENVCFISGFDCKCDSADRTTAPVARGQSGRYTRANFSDCDYRRDTNRRAWWSTGHRCGRCREGG